MQQTPSKKRLPWWLWAIIVLFSIGFISPIIAPKTKTDSEQKTEIPKEVRKQIQAKVNFTGTQFVITNANDFDWAGTEITINGKYQYQPGLMKSGSTYTIGAGQFTDNKNIRFNPFEIKPAEIRIWVEEPWSDSWYGELK